MLASIRRCLRPLLILVCTVLAAPLAHALDMRIAANPGLARPGEGVVVAVTVSNESGVAVSGVTVRVQVPTGVNSISPSFGSTGATCPFDCDPGELVTWNLGTIGAGQGVKVTMPFVVASATANGTSINFAATLLVGSTQTLAAAQAVTVDVDNALSLVVDADRDGAAPGQSYTYSVWYGNHSGTAVTGTALSLPLPAGVTFVSATGNGALSGNTVVWSLATLQGGESGRQQVVVNVGSGAASGTLLPVNVAQLTATSPDTGDELARAALVTRVQSNPVLALAIAPSNDPARQGEGVRTAFTVSNPTTSPVFGATLIVRMPTAGFLSISPSYHTRGATCIFDCDPYEFVTWNLGTLAPGSAVTVILAGVVANATASGRLINLDAELRADGVPRTYARRTLSVDGDNAFSLHLDVDKDGVAPGDTMTYTLSYGNRGPVSVTGTTLSLPLPVGVTFVSATGGGALVGNAVQWSLATVQSGQSARQQVVVSVGSGLASGSLLRIDAAVLSGTTATTGAEFARAALASRVLQRSDLVLATSAGADPARPGEGVRTAFTVSNRSPDTPAFGTVLVVRVPSAGFATIPPTYHSGGATCIFDCDPYEYITWNLGTIAPGAAVTVWTANTIASGFASGRLIAIESDLAADGLPQVLGHGTLTVDGDNALSLAVHADKDSAAPGERVTYVLDYANRSTGTVNGSVLAFPVPAGAALVGASPGATLTASRVTWNLGGVLAGAGGRRSVTVLVPAALRSGSQLVTDAATITGNSAVTGVETARGAASVRVVAGNPLRLALVSLLPNPVLPGQALTATWRITNTASVPLNTIRLRARVPMNGVNSFSPSALGTGASCIFDCDPYEFADWNFASLDAGASRTVTMPMTVSSGFGSGRQIDLQAMVTDDDGDQSIASGTATVGTQFQAVSGTQVFGDFNADGVVNFADVSLFKAAFGTTNPLYDLDGNGAVNFADLAILKTLFGNAGAARR